MLGNRAYDQDCITWNPSGRIIQVEYAMKAVGQGMPVLGLRSKTHVVICAYKRAQSELATHQEKIYKIDEHMCIGVAGITTDGGMLAEYMRNECLNHQYVYDGPISIGRLVNQIADKSQAKTQNSSKRPYGVGLLIGGVDETGPHLFETCPSGNYYEYYAMAIGGRSTSAKTYLEKHFESFADMDLDGLLQFALNAMNKTTTGSDSTLTAKSVSVAVLGVGENEKFRLLKEDDIQKYIEKIEKKEAEPDVAMDEAPPTEGGGGTDGAAPMDTS